DTTVVGTEAKGLLFAVPAVPVLHHKAQRRAALIEAFVLEWRELVQPREQNRSRSDHPCVRPQPAASLDGYMHEAVAGVRDEAEECPNRQVAGHDQRREPAPVRPLADE